MVAFGALRLPDASRRAALAGGHGGEPAGDAAVPRDPDELAAMVGGGRLPGARARPRGRPLRRRQGRAGDQTGDGPHPRDRPEGSVRMRWTAPGRSTRTRPRRKPTSSRPGRRPRPSASWSRSRSSRCVLLGSSAAGPSPAEARVRLFLGCIFAGSVLALVRLHATCGYCTPRHAMLLGLFLIPAAAAGLDWLLGKFHVPTRQDGLGRAGFSSELRIVRRRGGVFLLVGSGPDATDQPRVRGLSARG